MDLILDAGKHWRAPPRHRYRTDPTLRVLICWPTFGSAWFRLCEVVSQAPQWGDWEDEEGNVIYEPDLTVRGTLERPTRVRVPDGYGYDDSWGREVNEWTLPVGHEFGPVPITCVRKEE